jgi:quercetin dioxygenase-like cupin family protein
MRDVQPKHAVTYAGVAINIYHANAGEGLLRHEHEYAHATFCTAGSCIIRKENRELVLTKDSKPVNLIANEWHELEALEDGTVFINVFATTA